MSSDQQHRITYKAGITRTPSDFLCQDGELAECINLTTDNEELKPVVQPSVFIGDVKYRLLYVHKFNDHERYILLDGNNIKWGEVENDTFSVSGKEVGGVFVEDVVIIVSGNPLVTSIGKTLIISDNNGIHYILWKEEEYENLGPIPEPDVDFKIYHNSHCAIHKAANAGFDRSGLTDDGQEDYNNWAVGLYQKNLKTIAHDKGFCKPFFVRAAVKLYDNTYTLITQPFLMLPCVRHNTYGSYGNAKSGIVTLYGKLRYVQKQDYGKWSDIVKDVTLFITDGESPYDLTLDVSPEFVQAGDVYADGVWYNPSFSENYMNFHEESIPNNAVDPFLPFKDSEGTNTHRTDIDIINGLKGKSVFYKLCDIGISKEEVYTDVGKFLETHTLENITTQERLTYDDYFSRSPLTSKFIYAYNSRLNIANLTRGIFGGFSEFMPYETSDGSESYYRLTVRIQTDNGERFAEKTIKTDRRHGFYFFYPDSRADHVWIYMSSTLLGQYSLIVSADLKEHVGLNAAVYLGELPSNATTQPTVVGNDDYPSSRPTAPELLPNYIVTSEVNNPFVFKATGYNKVGTGKILGMSTTTMALSQDQFGKTPLIVFSDSGLWGMQVDGTGLFESIYPITRDVCINPNSITQTDGAVFFVSQKGLMVVSENGVKCVSGMINGKPFNTSTLAGLGQDIDAEGASTLPWASVIKASRDYVQGFMTTGVSFLDYITDTRCMMAYDYIDSRIYIINPAYGFSFVYNMAHGSISKTVLPTLMTNVVNDYPDYLMQGTVTETVEGVDVTRNVLYTLYGKPPEEHATSRQTAFLLTRPMKFGGPVGKTSLRELLNVGFWDEGTVQTPLSCVKAKLYISDDMKNWYEDTSRFGAAAKYFRLALFIKMLPTERLSGTVIRTQDRRTDNMI